MADENGSSQKSGRQKNGGLRRFLKSWAGAYVVLLAFVDFVDWSGTVLFGSQRHHPSVQEMLVVSTFFILQALQELASRIEGVGRHIRADSPVEPIGPSTDADRGFRK